MIGISRQRIWPYEKDKLLPVIWNKFPTIDELLHIWREISV